MKKNATDFKVKNQKVIIRCDLNVPIKNGIIEDDTRIKKSLDTIEYLINGNAKVIILSHLGRIKDENDKNLYSLKPIAKRMSELLYKEVKFIPFTRGVEVEDAINNMKPQDVIMLENTRFEDLNGNLESKNDMELSKYWASLGDLFINDAFGTLHRSHASNVGIATFLPSAMGFLVKEEVEKISECLTNSKKPLVVILGGAKVSDKIGVIKNAVEIADKVIITGGMPYTFFKSLGYNVGLSIVDNDSIDFCKEIYKKYRDKIVLPIDLIVAQSISEYSQTRLTNRENIGDKEIGVDIGTATINLYKSIVMTAGTIIWNGPCGVFEISKFSNGTRKLVEFLNITSAKILIGGGDTISAINKFEFKNTNAHISTGGGASLEMLEGKELPGLKVISDK